MNVDSIKIISFLSGFYNARFEYFVDDPIKTIYDSLRNIEPYQKLKLTPREGNPIEMHTYFKPNPYTEDDMEARYFESRESKWDRERLWAIVNDGQDLVSVQYFVFGRILQPINYFYSRDEKLNVQN